MSNRPSKSPTNVQQPRVYRKALSMDAELDRFKQLDLSLYAATQGYQLVHREQTSAGSWRGSTSSSLLMRHPGTNDKIVIRRDTDGHWIYFSVRDPADNGTVIDFLQRRQSMTLGAVRLELRSWSGHQPLIATVPHYEPPIDSQRRNRAAVLEAFSRTRLVDNSAYLNRRGIRPETLNADRLRGTWLVDERDNVIFPHRDGPAIDAVCGWEKKNRGFTGFATGGVKTIWTSNARPDDSKIVFTESAIDSFSYHQLHSEEPARYASTGGAIGDRLGPQYIKRAIAAMPTGSTVVTATDNDAAGERYALQIADLAAGTTVVRHVSPVGKDWNDCLKQHERDYIRSLDRKAPEI